MNSWW